MKKHLSKKMNSNEMVMWKSRLEVKILKLRRKHDYDFDKLFRRNVELKYMLLFTTLWTIEQWWLSYDVMQFIYGLNWRIVALLNWNKIPIWITQSIITGVVMDWLPNDGRNYQNGLSRRIGYKMQEPFRDYWIWISKQHLSTSKYSKVAILCSSETGQIL